MNVDQYLKKVSKMIYYSRVRTDIRQELLDTFEDMIDDYESQGMSREVAEEEAIRQMGDPNETGCLFNQVYQPTWDWKAAFYTLVWALFVGILNVSGILYGFAPTYEDVVFSNFAGGFLLILGILWSAVESFYDFPFFYVRNLNWGSLGLGSISNSLLFAGVGIGLVAKDWVQLPTIYGIVTFLLLIERATIHRQHDLKEQKYLYETCRALEDFNCRGKVNLNGQVVKVQLPRGQAAVKDSLLLIVGLDGFTLVAENV